MAVRESMDLHGVRQLKALGQNFLIDKNIPEKIVRLAGIDKQCGVLEIGPGLGALTVELGSAAGRVVAVELDRRLLPLLGERLAERQNVEIVQGDILKLDINGLVCGKMPELRHQVCANLPYNITTPVLTLLIDSHIFERITVMLQREVARRICAGPGSPDYSAFSVYMNYHAEPEILFDVPPECFSPRPKVHSSVVKIDTRSKRLLEPEKEKVFFRVVRAAFGQRRKTLVNALHSVFGSSLGKEDIAGFVMQCGFGANVRGEKLGIEDFARLAEYFGNAECGIRNAE